jgi:hypothetical protein
MRHDTQKERTSLLGDLCDLGGFIRAVRRY